MKVIIDKNFLKLKVQPYTQTRKPRVQNKINLYKIPRHIKLKWQVKDRNKILGASKAKQKLTYNKTLIKATMLNPIKFNGML